MTHDTRDNDLIAVIFAYALCFNGYHAFPDVGSMANERLAEFKETGRWRGSARELRGCLFFEQRRWRHFGYEPEGEDASEIVFLFDAVQERIRQGDFAPNYCPEDGFELSPWVAVDSTDGRLLSHSIQGDYVTVVVAIDQTGAVIVKQRPPSHVVTDDSQLLDALRESRARSSNIEPIMPTKPQLGLHYSREEINAMLGGGVQAFLPTKNGKVVCGCFKLDLNPDAPGEVLVGVGVQREASARVAVLQRTPFPIFLKREVGEWEYVGDYRATRYLDRGHKLLEAEERAQRQDVAGILYMEPAEQ